MLSIMRDFVASPLLLQLFLEFSAVLLLALLSKNDSEEAVPWIWGLVGLFFVRDLSQQILPSLPLALSFTVLAPICMVGSRFWRVSRKLVIGFGLAFLVLAVVSAILPEVGRFGPLASALIAIPLIVFRPDSRSVAVSLDPLALLLGSLSFIIPPLAMLFLPAASDTVQRLLIPLSYIFLTVAVLDYAKIQAERIIKDRDELSDTIDTLYTFVLKASSSLGRSSDFAGLTDYVAQTLAMETDSDGVLVMMIDDFEDVIATHALYGQVAPFWALPEAIPRDTASIDRYLKELKIPLGEGLLGEMARTGKPLLVENAREFSGLVIEEKRKAGSIIIVPLLIQDRVMGLACLVRGETAPSFTDGNFDRASLLADFSSLVINNVFSFQEISENTDIDTAASIAADIQKTIRPKKIRDFPNASFGFFTTPARGVCGDYFDVIAARRDKIYLVMGDVAGKGVPASLIMVMIRAILHLVTNTDKDAATILNWVNRGITGKIDLDHFATLQILIVDPVTGKCEYANAGHRSPLIWKNSDNLVDAVDMQSVPIGVEKATNYSSMHFTLENNDIVVLYTDGVVETINQSGKQYGVKSLTTILHKAHEQSATEIADKINTDIRAFAGSVRQHDDQTLLVLKVKR